ncbi:MAG: GNAT family N-acetyltransferase [Cellulosilyticum sp.]|nr:GNAT family N-acetyltransferase [Cellulosilyticum sp.]
MKMENLIIRKMEPGERKAVVKVGRKAFEIIEGIFLPMPKTAMVAEYEGKIIGGIIYSAHDTKKQKIGYIDDAFVDPDYHGLGVGKKLYTETFRCLEKEGYKVITGLVKCDNVGSWKLFIDNGFRRASFLEIIRQIGLVGMIKQYFETPYFAAIGMDFYLLNKQDEVKEKTKNLPQLLAFFLCNLLVVCPLGIRLFNEGIERICLFLLAYITVLAVFILPRLLGGITSKRQWHFRFNNGGSFISLGLSTLGTIFPMNANWYPDHYENTKVLKRQLALPELVKWCLFSLLVLFDFATQPYFHEVARISCNLLIFSVVPLYPFEGFGAGRIYRYNRKLWLVTAIITAIEVVLLS